MVVLLKRLCSKIFDNRMDEFTKGAIWSGSPRFMTEYEIYPRQ